MKGRWSLPVVLVLGILALFVAAPLASLFVRAVRFDTGDIPSLGALHRVARFTILQATVSAAAAVIAALPAAYAVSHFAFPGRRAIVALSLLPFVLPSIIVVVAMIAFFGKNGAVNRLLRTDWNVIYSFAGIVLAHVYYNVSLAVRILSSAWAGIDRRYGESARSLGERLSGVLFRVTLPLMRPAIVTAFTLVFLYSFLSFGVVLVFGGVRFATFEVAIYREFFVNLDFRSAGVYALAQIAFTALFASVSSRTIHRERGGIPLDESQLPALHTASAPVRVFVSIYLTGVVIFLLGPIAAMVGRTLTNAEVFRDLFAPGIGARSVESIVRSSVPAVVARSLGIALVSGTATFGLATALALSIRGTRRPLLETAVQIPIGVSVVSVALGLRILWGFAVPPVLLVIAGQIIVALPVVFRIARSGVDELSDRYVNAAQILGARRMQVFRTVELPLLRRTLVNAYAYAVALPFADITIVLTVGRGKIVTFPVAIYRLIGFRSFDLAVALAVVYVALCLALFVAIDATSEKREG